MHPYWLTVFFNTLKHPFTNRNHQNQNTRLTANVTHRNPNYVEKPATACGGGSVSWYVVASLTQSLSVSTEWMKPKPSSQTTLHTSWFTPISAKKHIDPDAIKEALRSHAGTVPQFCVPRISVLLIFIIWSQDSGFFCALPLDPKQTHIECTPKPDS